MVNQKRSLQFVVVPTLLAKAKRKFSQITKIKHKLEMVIKGYIYGYRYTTSYI